jgi:hypothetical protein
MISPAKAVEETSNIKTGPVKPKQCECADRECPAHRGSSECRGRAQATLFRVDMTDRTGTRFCTDCTFDAWESGLFSTVPQ